MFTFPAENALWTDLLWKNLIKKHLPNGPNDFIMRIIPFAANIEAFDAANTKIVEELVKEKVEADFNKKYENLYNDAKVKNKEQWIAAQLRLKPTSKINELEKTFDNINIQTLPEYQAHCFTNEVFLKKYA